jgi:YD repeat-containing protein
VTSPVTFGYDNAGNRISMQDGLGTVSYQYNHLSQLVSETRAFTDSLPIAPLPNNSFKLEYEYTLSGQLKSYKDPYGQQINYAYDKVGRLNSVAGSTAFGGVTSYANNQQYRAWGALKSLSYGNSSTMQMTYNNRLQAASYVMSKNGTNEINKEYRYLSSGEISNIDDKLNINSETITDSERFDRSYKYDHLGRVIEARSGAEARGGTDSLDKIPYGENLTYDGFGHTTSLEGLI